MKFILLIATFLACIEARYVTRAARDRARHIVRKYESMFGHGLTGLIHPVTKEFNHAAMIELRGGRNSTEEHLFKLSDIGVHHLLGQIVGADKKKLVKLGEKTVDAYDFVSFFYGWILALAESKTNQAGANKCFYAMFDTINIVDYLILDLRSFLTKWFDILAFYPTNIANNAAVVYQ